MTDHWASLEVRLSQATVLVELDISSIDTDAERRRLEKQLATAQGELESTKRKLGNEAFLAKAPADVVHKIRNRHDLASEEIGRIASRLEGLQCRFSTM